MFISLFISLVSISISLFTVWRTLYYEKQQCSINILSVCSPEDLVSPLAGILYVELLVTNNSALPLVLLTSSVTLTKHDNDYESNAYLIDTLISTHKEQTGTTVNRKIEHKSQALPINIPPRQATSFILAFPVPGILGVDKTSTKIDIVINTNRDKLFISNDELSPKMITLYQFLKERVRIA